MAEYIEREAFIAQKRELYCKDCDRRKGMKNGKYRILYDIGDVPCRACGIEDVLSDVEDFPAAEVQPVRYGKWVGRELGYCTCCGHRGCASDIWNGCGDIYYCPNCGAIVDGDKNG